MVSALSSGRESPKRLEAALAGIRNAKHPGEADPVVRRTMGVSCTRAAPLDTFDFNTNANLQETIPIQGIPASGPVAFSTNP
jgi:hypothetical protein